MIMVSPMTAARFRERLEALLHAVDAVGEPLDSLRLAWQKIDDIRHLMGWPGGRPTWEQPIYDQWEAVNELQALARSLASYLLTEIDRQLTPPKR